MTSPETTVLRQHLASLIERRALSTDPGAVAAVARAIQDDLMRVLAPLISTDGVEALSARAFDLAKREYPVSERSDDRGPTNEPATKMSLWLELQVPSAASDAAAAMFATFAELLTALIGETLTMQYLAKAWPDPTSFRTRRGRRGKEHD